MSTNTNKNVIRRFIFEPSDINKYIVLKFRYEEHILCNTGPLGSRLVINKHTLNIRNTDYLYGVYKIDWYDDYTKSHNDVSYKIKLTPVSFWDSWCPNRPWYTSDIEQIINSDYNLFEEIPVFDTYKEAEAFALKKNNEIYPYVPTIWEKIKSFFKITKKK